MCEEVIIEIKEQTNFNPLSFSPYKIPTVYSFLDGFPDMATPCCALSEELLRCPVCLDLLNLPVSTPCGHNFCKDCIRGYWQSTALPQCPVCKQKYDRRPELKVNTLVSEITAHFKKSLGRENEDRAGTVPGLIGDVCDDASVGKRVQNLKSFCETQLNLLTSFKKPDLLPTGAKTQDKVCKKHKKPLDLFCTTDQMCVCKVCVKKEHRAHQSVPVEQEGRGKRAQIGEKITEVEDLIGRRLQKIDQIIHRVQLSRGNAGREVQESCKVFDKLLQLIRRGQEELDEAICAKQRQVERRSRGLIAGLEQEIEELAQRQAELERLSCAEDDLEVLCGFAALCSLPAGEERMESCVVGTVYVGTVSRGVLRMAGQLEQAVKAEIKRLHEMDIQRARRHAVEVTLDPDTAHPKLVLSVDRRQVHHSDLVQELPDNLERFYPGISVLGEDGFSSGRFYYEVQVRGKTEWDIGVGLGSVNRKGGIIVNPENGYWALGMRQDYSLWALSSSPTCVTPVELPHRVGIYVDVDFGQVSFYDVDAVSHIYTFTRCSFSERLFPYFNPRRNHSGVNSAPLIILPVVV